MKFEIQERDIQVMKFAFAFRAVTCSQILRRHFKESNEAYALRRIRQLTEEGFLDVSSAFFKNRPVKVLLPNPSIWQHIAEKWPYAIDNPLFKSESPEHDVRLAEIFLRLEMLATFRNFFSENLLQSSAAIARAANLRDTTKTQSDGLIALDFGNGSLKRYAVELEITRKAPERYREKLLSYYLAEGIDGVIYITANEEIRTLVAKADKSVCNGERSRVYLTLESNLVSNEANPIFTTTEGYSLELV